MRRLILAALLAAAPAAAQEDRPGPNLEITVAGEVEGTIIVDLFPDVAPQHVERLTTLAKEGAYDNVVFHRVIGGFMAQTGDVQFGRAAGDLSRAGMGASNLPNVPAEFSEIPFERGVVGMGRRESIDSANAQFFIMFAPAPHLNGGYTVVGRVIEGMDVVDAIKRGDPDRNGAVTGMPDVMENVEVVE